MHPEIASIHGRLEKGGDWMDFRNEIARLHGEATTQDEYVTLLEAHHRLVAVAEHCFEPEKCAQIRQIAFGEYKMFLNVEAMEDGVINPVMLDRITRREVEAGRLAEGDGLRQLASAGVTLGDSADSKFDRKVGDWVGLSSVALGIVAGLLSNWRVGLIVAILGMGLGWFLNERSRKAALANAQASRADRGYG